MDYVSVVVFAERGFCFLFYFLSRPIEFRGRTYVAIHRSSRVRCLRVWFIMDTLESSRRNKSRVTGVSQLRRVCGYQVSKTAHGLLNPVSQNSSTN